jgi:cyclophilin family peptidyl-prolyl cis-trans isomerase
MAQHKAPTAVTIAATTEKSGLALVVERYWKLGALLAVGITGLVIYKVSSSESRRAERARGWDALLAVTSKDPVGGLAGVPEELRTIADRDQSSEAAPWALFIAARSSLEKKDYEGAKRSLEQLQASYPTHALVAQAYEFHANGTPMSPVDALSARVQALETWVREHSALFENPPPPADAPRVRINTDKGSVVVQLYSTAAPKHAEHFLRLAREGAYSGTKFHSVRKGSWVQGGDPSSKDSDVTAWGKDTSEGGVDGEDSSLRHFAGYLGMWRKPGESRSLSHQFYLTTGAAHSQDGQTVLFGKVVEGMEVLTAIEGGALAEGTERPVEPVTIQSVEAL